MNNNEDVLNDKNDMKDPNKTELILTNSQKEAYDNIIQFLNSNDIIIVLKGCAGTGKTTLMKYIIKYISNNFIDMFNQICCITPTHKAKNVLNKIIDNNNVNVITIASYLGKIRDKSYIGEKKFVDSGNKKNYKYLILDELSMVSDKDTREILSYIINNNKKLIAIGDNYQIPSISQKYTIDKKLNCLTKPDNYLFNSSYIVNELTEITRQKKNSPILDIASYIRNNINTVIDLKELIDPQNILTSNEAYKIFNPSDSKIIAYTNMAVRKHNLSVRNTLGYNEKFVINDILMGYNNVGYPKIIIENGHEYMITICDKTYIYIKPYIVFGYKLELFSCVFNNKQDPIFIIDIKNTKNLDFINMLAEKASILNSNGYNINDYKEYYKYKNKVVFMEDVYLYDGKYYSENELVELHPLLFTNLNEIINIDKLTINEECEKVKLIREVYGDLIEKRLKDYITLLDTETLASKYKVIEKDIYYGYSITAHKSQGSTYKTVFLDNNDFQKITNKWNKTYNMFENRIKEANQLKYVACTGSSHNLYLID